MTKRNWTVHVPGYPPFPMIELNGEIDHAEALRSARLIWSMAEVV